MAEQEEKKVEQPCDCGCKPGEGPQDQECCGPHGAFHIPEEFLRKFNVESLKELKALGRELRDYFKQNVSGVRINVLMVRVEDETLKSIDAMLEAEIFRSRSEAAAYLIKKGLESTREVFGTVQAKTKEIERLRGEIRDMVGVEKDKSAPAEPDKVEPTPGK
ncbi:MAG: ribbon-helix-helix domain-containing protein [Candidatus Brocadiia bacterium]